MAPKKKIIGTDKTCNTCGRTFPRNSYYFRRMSGYADGFKGKCKECDGKKFTDPALIPPKIITDGLTCDRCRKKKSLFEFYDSINPLHPRNKIPICKLCCDKMSIHYKAVNANKAKKMLQRVDKPFIYDAFRAAMDAGVDIIGTYFRILDKPEYKYLTYKDSIHEPGLLLGSPMHEEKNIIKEINDNSKKNKEDVLNILGYDPFSFELEDDKPDLYNRLVDFLDEQTVADKFKIPIVIEIVKSFKQVEKINLAITQLNTQSILDNVGQLKNLMDTKSKILSSVLSMAKDNGISINYSNNKSKGAGTLSGIIKELQQSNLEDAKVNLYNIKTCEGMRQVADISNQSILNQLMLNESDYTDMINDQRKMILEYESKNSKLEEENRLLKIKLKYYESKE